MAKRTEHPSEWSIRFEDTSTLRAVADAVSVVQQRVSMRVAKDDDRYVLSIDTGDFGMNSVVCVRLYIESDFVTCESSVGFEFCISCQQLQVALDSSACSHGSLLLSGKESTVTLQVTSNVDGQEERTTLSCLVDNERPTLIEPITMCTRLEIEVPGLREFLKKARKFHAERMRLRIFLHEEMGMVYSLVIYSLEADVEHEQMSYYPATRDEDNSLRLASGMGDSVKRNISRMTPHYNSLFAVERLDSILKVFTTRKLLADLKQGLPMLLTNRIGGGSEENESFVRYLIAPLNDDN